MFNVYDLLSDLRHQLAPTVHTKRQCPVHKIMGRKGYCYQCVIYEMEKTDIFPADVHRLVDAIRLQSRSTDMIVRKCGEDPLPIPKYRQGDGKGES